MSPLLLWAIRAVLLIEAGTAALSTSWPQLLISLATLALTFLPDKVARMMGVRLPTTFLSLIALFIFATIFLGEAKDMYERYWWWDILLHFGSAVTFGLFGFLAIFVLFEGDRYAAPPWAIGFLSACVAIAIGVLWEIFEFGMDQAFGLNMQKSGLPDTMGDLIVDTLGAMIGGGAGYLYLKGLSYGYHGLIEEFLHHNKRFYGRLRRRPD